MGNRNDDRSSRMGPHSHDSRHGHGHGHGHGRAAPPDRGAPGRVFDRDEDMGGAEWSGASGRGGMSYESHGGHPHERGYGERGYASPRHGPSGYGASGYGPSGYGPPGYGPPGYGPSGQPERGYGRDEGVFIREHGYGHVPGQRWGGGYGGDRDRDPGRVGPESGRGFTGSDFGGMSPREPHRGPGYGYEGSDMGMGSPDRGPHYGKGPKGYKRSDARTREEVCEAIAHQGHIDASDVEVKVENGIVTLTGTVGQRHHKRALEHLVEHCRGVDEVHNELRLKREELKREEPKREEPKREEPKREEPKREAKEGLGDGDGNYKNGKSRSS